MNDTLIFILVAFPVGFLVAAAVSWWERRKIRKEFIKKRSCSACKHRGTEKCPDEYECYRTAEKPFFEPRGLNEEWADKNELKPCPFCGKHAYIGQRKRIAGDRFTPLCSNSTCAASGATKYFYNRSEAVEAWNRRANDGKASS